MTSEEPTNKKVISFPDEITEFEDSFQQLCWALTQWPGIGKQLPMPTNRAMAPYQSDILYRLGLRYHPDLATLFKIPDPDPDAPRDAGIFVDRAAYDEWLGSGSAEEQVPAQARQIIDLLRHIDPARAETVERMAKVEAVEGTEEAKQRALDSLNDLIALKDVLKVKPE